jgi:LacI family transcriptional regulator
MEDFKTCKTPAILYDNHISVNPRVTHVGVDNAEGMELAVQYLKSLGHTKIGYLSSELEAYVYRQRYNAFFQALKNADLDASESLADCSFFINDSLLHLPRLLEQGCTAIVCSHDLLAHSAMVHCLQMGHRVPEDVSIMGFDDIPMCRYTLPPLSTIRQDRINIGKSAFYAMLNQLNNVHPSSLLLHPELVERASCAKK